MNWKKEYDEFISFMQEGWQLVRSSWVVYLLGLIVLYVLVVGLLIL